MTNQAKLLSTTIFFVVAGYLLLMYVNKVYVYPSDASEIQQNIITIAQTTWIPNPKPNPNTNLNANVVLEHKLTNLNANVVLEHKLRTESAKYMVPSDLRLDIPTIAPLSLVDWENASRLEHVAPRVFAEKPGQLLPDFKNPCWNQTNSSHVYCLPYFYLAGMPKCGTTDLWFKINQHPFIANYAKEPHWWTRKRIGVYESKLGNVSPPSKYYSRWYAPLNRASKSSGIGETQLIVGDGSASTFWDNHGWNRFYPHHKEGPPHVIAEAIAKIQPLAKIIVILRNPVDRLYSDYLFFTTNKTKTKQDFHTRVLHSLQHWKDCLKNHARRTCAYSTWMTQLNGIERSSVRLHIGMYSVYMRDWLKAFRRDQLLVLRLEDWRYDCSKVLKGIYAFLKLGALTKGQLHYICRQQTPNMRASDKEHFGPMLNETRQLLDQFYDPLNNELTDLLKNDAYMWR